MTARVLVPLLFLGACGKSTIDPTPDSVPDGFDRNALLAHLSNDIILPIQTTAAQSANALPAALDAHCVALDTGGDVTATRAAARAAWVAATDTWQAAEAVLIGPAAMNNKELRSKIYAWPSISTCELDRDTASRFANPNSYDISTKLVRVRSLFAIEYLLFPPGQDHTCVSTPIGWDALGSDLELARCRLAHAIALDVSTQVSTVETAWLPAGGDFAGQLARAGDGTSSFVNSHEGVNAISDGLFFVDYIVKDMKLAEPAGIADNACGAVGTPCFAELELPFADRATFAVRSNLRSLRAVFTGTTTDGTDGLGFDDFLREIGHGDVADRMIANLNGAIAAADAVPDSFTNALTNDYAKIVSAHTALKAFTDDLKSQFLTLLALELPDDVPADND
jgi:predicted lipoprotein